MAVAMLTAFSCSTEKRCGEITVRTFLGRSIVFAIEDDATGDSAGMDSGFLASAAYFLPAVTTGFIQEIFYVAA